MKARMCEYQSAWDGEVQEGAEKYLERGIFIRGDRPIAIKRKRLKCPKCGRRLMSSVWIHDNDIIHQIPPHKIKGWWKRK